MKVNAIEGYRVKNLTFESKKGKPTSSHHSTSPMKTVPVIVLMAMSPLNAPVTNARPLTSAQPQTEIASNQEKVIASYSYKNAAFSDKIDCNIHFISTDNDDSTAEKVKLNFISNDEFNTQDDNGNIVKTYRRAMNSIYADTLEVHNVLWKYADGYKEMHHEYYIKGTGTKIISSLKTEDGKVLEPARMFEMNNIGQRITKEFYDFMKKTMNDEIYYKEENRTILIPENYN